MKTRDSIQTISFIGSGNVATHLAAALQKAGHRIVEVFSPNIGNAKQFAEQFACLAVNSLQNLNAKVDLLIIAVPDAKVEAVAKAIPQLKGIVAHTSGITPMSVLEEARNYGVFYPLQTFTKDRKLNISDAPFCIEGSNKEVVKRLSELAGKISQSVQFVNSEQRKHLHLAAVMVSNFVNHLYGISHDFLESNQLDFDILLPLIHETAAKVQDISPENAQTGPARRNDELTLKSHLKMLKNSPENEELYRLFSEQIKKKYNE